MPKRHETRRNLTQPHPDRLNESHSSYEAIMLAHNQSLEADESGYIDPETGYFVFNAQALADQGKCCANICRHCPYKR